MENQKHLVKTLLYLHQQLERAADPLQMNMSQYHLLHFLHEKPRRAADFTAVSKLRKPGVASMVAILESRTWIERVPDPDDGRAQLIRITSAGLTAFNEFEDHMHSALQRFLGADAVANADRQLDGFFAIWNARRIERFENWQQSKRRKFRSSNTEQTAS